jgi:4'-phosphopantetheinyl transferase
MSQVQLQVGELHLWTIAFDPDDDALLEAAEKLLPERELQGFQRLKFKRSRTERIVSQAALRSLLTRYLGIPPAEVRLERSSKGKPWCADDPDIRFNMSHSEGLTAIGFAKEQEIGVDLERIRDLRDLEEVIRKSLNTGETEQLGKGPEQRRKDFFRFWTFKESYLKAVGEGMRLSPEKLEFRIRKGGVELLAAPYPFGEELPHFTEFAPHEGYTGTVTYRKEGTRILEKELKPDELIRQAQANDDHGAEADL